MTHFQKLSFLLLFLFANLNGSVLAADYLTPTEAFEKITAVLPLGLYKGSSYGLDSDNVECTVAVEVDEKYGDVSIGYTGDGPMLGVGTFSLPITSVSADYLFDVLPNGGLSLTHQFSSSVRGIFKITIDGTGQKTVSNYEGPNTGGGFTEYCKLH